MKDDFEFEYLNENNQIISDKNRNIILKGYVWINEEVLFWKDYLLKFPIVQSLILSIDSSNNSLINSSNDFSINSSNDSSNNSSNQYESFF